MCSTIPTKTLKEAGVLLIQFKFLELQSVHEKLYDHLKLQKRLKWDTKTSNKTKREKEMKRVGLLGSKVIEGIGHQSSRVSVSSIGAPSSYHTGICGLGRFRQSLHQLLLLILVVPIGRPAPRVVTHFGCSPENKLAYLFR